MQEIGKRKKTERGGKTEEKALPPAVARKNRSRGKEPHFRSGGDEKKRRFSSSWKKGARAR